MAKRQRLIVLMNPAAGLSGNFPIRDAVLESLRAAGAEPVLRPARGSAILETARAALREAPEALVAAGGDGTLSAVAAAVAQSDVPLGVMPIGTLNHFARDIGIPTDLRQAARIIVDGTVRSLDIGQANGHCFINNSSIGLYPHIVRHRNRHCQQLGRGKWLATLLAAISVLRRYPLVSVTIQAGGNSLCRTTPFVLIGNNRYKMNLLAMGARARLDEGMLSVYSTSRSGRFRLLKLMLRGLLGRLDQDRDFDDIITQQALVETHKRTLRVAFDGEVCRMTPPLHYRILPGALKVICP